MRIGLTGSARRRVRAPPTAQESWTGRAWSVVWCCVATPPARHVESSVFVDDAAGLVAEGGFDRGASRTPGAAGVVVEHWLVGPPGGAGLSSRRSSRSALL